MRLRPLGPLFALLSIAVVVLTIAGGCANGGDTNTSPGGSQCTAPQIPCTGDAGDACVDPTSDPLNCGACGMACPMGQTCMNAACTSACPMGQTMCGNKCVSLSSDNANCGMCGKACPAGQLCSASACAVHCQPMYTICGGPSSGDGGSDAASDASGDDGATDSSGGDDGATDATVPETGGGSDAAAGGDAGGSTPYCANLSNDPMNCGTCGRSCLPGHGCTNGACELSCPMGQTACQVSDTCIPTGTCCSDMDCMITGQHCPGPGDTCKCPTGQKSCMASNSCINSTTCCSDSECTVTGEKCLPGAGGNCACPNGGRVCPSIMPNGACIAPGTCCVQSDCMLMGETCNFPTPQQNPPVGGTCACPSGEQACVARGSCIPSTSACCALSGFGGTCGGATDLGPIAIGGLQTKTGVLPDVGDEHWFKITFPNQGQNNYHPHVKLTVPANNQMAIDVHVDCGGGLVACGEGGNCSGKNEWEVMAGSSPGDPTGQTYSAIPLVGTGGSVWVRVYRTGGSATCDTYTLAVSD